MNKFLYKFAVNYGDLPLWKDKISYCQLWSRVAIGLFTLLLIAIVSLLLTYFVLIGPIALALHLFADYSPSDFISISARISAVCYILSFGILMLVYLNEFVYNLRHNKTYVKCKKKLCKEYDVTKFWG